jgi:6-phosphogluconolactonase (cycloisomerase 2 family)
MGWLVVDARFALFSETRMLPTNVLSTLRALYAVNQASAIRGSISVYDIDRGHRLVKTISTVANVDDVRGVVVSPTTGKLYVSYRTKSGVGMIYCLDVYKDVVLWNRVIKPDVDRLSIDSNGRFLYVPTFEDGSADYINVLDADSGDVVRQVHFSNRSHDSQFPLSGPLFQETKATDGSGKYLYMIDPSSYAVSRIGPYSGILGPYAVDSRSRYVVNNVTGVWGMQVAELKTGQIVSAIVPRQPLQQSGLLHGITSATISSRPPEQIGLLHGIGWTPDETEVWHNSSHSDPHVYVWDMLNPMGPKFKAQLKLRAKHGAHWLTFDLKGDHAYIAPEKNSDEGTEIFDARTHNSIGSIGSSEDIVEIDFKDGSITRTADQYGIGRAAR